MYKFKDLKSFFDAISFLAATDLEKPISLLQLKNRMKRVTLWGHEFSLSDSQVVKGIHPVAAPDYEVGRLKVFFGSVPFQVSISGIIYNFSVIEGSTYLEPI
jgi:hypothetical protein